MPRSDANAMLRELRSWLGPLNCASPLKGSPYEAQLGKVSCAITPDTSADISGWGYLMLIHLHTRADSAIIHRRNSVRQVDHQLH
jgi:hypothetical protein